MWGVIGPILLLIVICFGFVLLYGPPYLPTLTKQLQAALVLADLKPGQRLLELGCGDGKVLLAAAKQGALVTGLELNPLLVLLCKIRCWRYRDRVTVRWANFWKQDWGQFDVIFIFGLPRIMQQVDTKVMQETDNKVKLVSFAFAIPGKSVSRRNEGVYLYEYAAASKA